MDLDKNINPIPSDKNPNIHIGYVPYGNLAQVCAGPQPITGSIENLTAIKNTVKQNADAPEYNELEFNLKPGILIR